MERNIGVYRGSYYEAKINAGKTIWARKLTKELGQDIRVRHDKALPADRVKWHSGNIEIVKKADW
ncbi:hypothetical protein G3A_17505 [Bacillus sp. 17376]|uniref:Uncharacterized protein n=1 Tax=Mesobacillus boroniphilus JCM 21738 TaxID=1294265 RepID=W4RWH9_9BACI|nr:hypothetical protein [Mesobacillus boroniphilus]ESU31291.1 hypothetical protein G3A_17505 [Bacillus sp. 17376]GAE48447.1 hypothetical protein JCM21738_5584 [Mesobacillus boroniphilus JCM 21738]